jgi:signal transduction histidine kinase
MVVLTSVSDAFHIFGITDFYMTLPIGVISGIFLLALSANQQIENTYKERDSLLLSLESKVQEKTKDLNQAMENLKQSQAELIQSAKLASLGTLSAGIAHEINNSINFVNGAIIPLEKKVLKHIPEDEKASISKLFNVIKHGTDLTVQIVRSLRNFTGLNQASFREINVAEVVNSVTTILRSKLTPIKLNVNIENGLNFEGSQVGVSQALMNIITNSIDALPEINPEITIEGKTLFDTIELKITDNGSGIPKSLINRIFDPFFTTKQVGKGTGLGLFIVKKEVDRHNGYIKIESEPSSGTTFTLSFPIKNIALETSMTSEAS